MASNSSGGSQINVPQARDALNNMKYEIARELGVNLKQGYNGDLTSREAGSVGGQMVKLMCPVRTMSFTRRDRTAPGHRAEITYRAGLRL